MLPKIIKIPLEEKKKKTLSFLGLTKCSSRFGEDDDLELKLRGGGGSERLNTNTAGVALSGKIATSANTTIRSNQWLNPVLSTQR